MLDADLWDTLCSLFDKIAPQPPDVQERLIVENCQGNKELESQLRRIVGCHGKTSFLDEGVGIFSAEIEQQLHIESLAHVGPYTVVRELGAGGMGQVYLAYHDVLKKEAAIKVPSGIWISPQHRPLFEVEQKSLALLDHVNICRIYDGQTLDDGTPWIAMEYVDGERVTTYCKRVAPSIRQMLDLFCNICNALQYVHSRGVVHCDLKPSNILVTADGIVKLLDFGIAKQISKGIDAPISDGLLKPLTRAYAAPEQVSGGETSVETDVFALGVLLRELLTGDPPQQSIETSGANSGSNEVPRSVAEIFRLWKITKPQLAELNAVIQKATRTDAAGRYRTADALMSDIRHFLENEPLDAYSGSALYRWSKSFRRNQRPLGIAFAVLVVIFGLTTVYAIRLTRARDAALRQVSRAEHIKTMLLRVIGGSSDSAPSTDLRVKDVLGAAFRNAQELDKEPDVQADLYETLGNVYEALGDYDKADSAIQRAIAKRRLLQGRDNIELGETILALASIRVDQARFREAEQLAREESEVAKRELPLGRKLLGESMTVLGNSLLHDGRFAESIGFLKEAIKLQTGRKGEESVLTESLGLLANAYLITGQELAAQPLEEQVLEKDRLLNGDRSPGVAEDLANISQLQIKRGLYTDAELNGRQALAIDIGWYGKENAEVALLEETLAESLVYTGKYQEAHQLLTSGLLALEKEVGKNHPYYAYGLNLSGQVALHQGDLKEAQSKFDQMRDIYSATLSGNDSRLALYSLRCGELYITEHKFNEAESLFRQALNQLIIAMGADSPMTGSARVELGDVLLREHKEREAESELKRGYADLTKEGDTSTIRAVQAREDLGKLSSASLAER